MYGFDSTKRRKTTVKKPEGKFVLPEQKIYIKIGLQKQASRCGFD